MGFPAGYAERGLAPVERARGVGRLRTLLSRSQPGGREPPLTLDTLIRLHRAVHQRADVRLLHRAYAVAEELHRGQRRSSGEPFIVHPLAVAIILAELGMDTTTLAAALLHDTVEDTSYTLEQVEEAFGDDVAYLVDGVTKLEKQHFGEAADAETIRKMIVATGRDLRVLVIKLADRLHNMRTLGYRPPHKQERTARATLEVLVPLADRLGIQAIKRELEDLAFATLYPREHARVVRLLQERADERKRYLEAATKRLVAYLRSARVKATVTARPRHLYAIYQDMQERDVAGVHDAARLVVVVAGEARDCYVALGVVHRCWSPVPGRFKDFIATPKFNMYRSLHTTVMGPERKPLEVQVRTRDMHRTAEYGICATYTVQGGEARDRSPEDLAWLRRLLDWQRSVHDPGQFFESLRSDLTEQEVLVFTPKGDVVTLPRGATPLDLAYNLHAELGHRCIGARVNGSLVPLSSVLADGDTVEILTGQHAKPSLEWLNFVKSPKARIKINEWLESERADNSLERGRQAVGQALQEQGHHIDDEALAMLDDADLETLYMAVGRDRLPAQSVAQWLLTVLGKAWPSSGGTPEPEA